MRLAHLAFCYTFLLASSVYSLPIHRIRATLSGRDLIGLLSGGDPNIPLPPVVTAQTTPETKAIIFPTVAPSTVEGGPAEQTARPKTTLASTALRKKSKAAATQFVFAPQQAAGATTRFASSNGYPTASPVTYQVSLTVPSSSSSSESWSAEETGDVLDASSTPPAELKEWKVIGIAVISITFIAILVLAVTFFDAWWGFLCAAVCGKRRGKRRKGIAYPFSGETMVPDWERRSWEFKLASEDGHRYPTMASLESIVKDKEKDRKQVRFEARTEAGFAQPRLLSPEAVYPRY
ncbi:hypothetical protein CPC08DRAFT_519513 [Agrocybe pediades]|nr:hypothetical protein CPC08DRAFT_519513 [Agrocybe pediades]